MWVYTKVVLLFSFCILLFGVLLPFLFSASSTELVAAGYVLLFVSIPAVAFAAKNILINSFKKVTKNEED